MSGLTTHVLDTMHGRPAAGVALRLLRAGQAIARAVTNADGRCDAAADRRGSGGRSLSPGVRRRAYYRGLGVSLPEPAFLETVAIEFGVAEESGHYHVPLLVSPFAYSTYRGS